MLATKSMHGLARPKDYAAMSSMTQADRKLRSPHHRHMWIITGPAGCGKSTIAQYLAKELSIPYIEGDDVSSGVFFARLFPFLIPSSTTQPPTKRKWPKISRLPMLIAGTGSSPSAKQQLLAFRSPPHPLHAPMTELLSRARP